MWCEVVVYSCRETLRHPSQDVLLLTFFARLTCQFDVFHSSVPSELNTRCKMGQSWELHRPWSCFHARVRRCFVPRNVACHIHDEALPLAPPKHIFSPHLWNALPLRGTWSMHTFLIMVCDQHECGWGVLSIPQKKRWKELNGKLNKPTPEICLIPVLRLREINSRTRLTVCLERSLSLPDPSRLMNNEWAGQKQLPFGDTSWWMITGSTGSVFA